MISARASGKIILFGEHAVVYGRPAIAVPVTQVQAHVTIEDASTGFTIRALDQNRVARYSDLNPSDPLGTIIRLALLSLGATATPNAALTISSTIPIASGLGSGAAVSTAIVRALAKYFGRDLPAQTISDLVYQVEKIHHGTPSGIDNTVIAFEQPVYYVRPTPPGTPPIYEFINGGGWGGGKIAIADTGIASPTKIAVGDVRKGWEANPAKYESLFDQCGAIANQARALIESGQPSQLGPLMTQNQTLLRELTVSSPELETLIQAALSAGALGAKLSGGGRGGNMIALVTDETETAVKEALLNAGAKRVITTTIGELEN
jgi:mevalonate kinase